MGQLDEIGQWDKTVEQNVVSSKYWWDSGTKRSLQSLSDDKVGQNAVYNKFLISQSFFDGTVEQNSVCNFFNGTVGQDAVFNSYFDETAEQNGIVRQNAIYNYFSARQ